MGFNRVGILLLCGLLFLIASCIQEDRDNCFCDYSYKLSFIYYGDGTTDIFGSKIENVQAYVFDSEGRYVDNYICSKSELDAFQGVYLDLEPGEYDIVCWSNITDWSEITGGGGMQYNQYLYSSFYLSGKPIVNFDSLYYGMRTINVPANMNAGDTVYFNSAHINMLIYIEGLPSTAGTYGRAVGDTQGWIIVRNVFVGYNFYMEVTPETAEMYPSLTSSTGNDLLTAAFNLLRFNDNNDIVIDIYNGDGKIVYSLALSDFLVRNNISVEGVEEITIPIHIRFEGVNVSVSVPEWDSENVKPVI